VFSVDVNEEAKEPKEQDQKKEQSLSDETKIELKEKLREINRQLMTMDWDKKHNQLNPGIELKYSQLRTEHDKIVKELGEGN
jgi:hypothetical protein